MIDLSYLTEEEQGMIMSVLKRDTELKKVEEDRIKGLKRILSDKGKLKYLTGEWFYEAKSQRHRDRIHGSDIIKASLRKKNPITQLEIKQSEQPSLVNNENRNNLVPPTPLGNTETISAQPNDNRESNPVPPNVQQARLNLAARSPSRQRHNPFNEGSLEMETSERLDWQLANRADEQLKTSGGDLFSPSKPDIARPISVNSEGSGSLQGINIKVAPVPKKRKIIYKPQDSFSDSDGSAPRWIERTESQSNSNPQRGILKQSSSCSSNDSGLFINDNGRLLQPTKTPTSIHNSAYPDQNREPVDAMLSERLEDVVNWLDRKQVRFSPPVSLRDTESASLQQDGREYRENDLLDLESSTPSDNEGETVKLDKNRENYEAENGPVSDHEKLLEGVNMHLDITGIHLRTTEPQSAPTPCAELSLSDNISQPQQNQHAESHAPQVSYFPSPVEEKGKHIHTHVGGSEVYSKPEAPILKPADGEGDSLTKVLEWFSRSIDSIDRQDEDAGWKEFKEAKQESSTPKDKKKSEDSATSHPVETQSPTLSSVLLERSYGVHAKKGQEKSDDKVPTVGKEDSSDSKPMYHAVHSSLTPETAYKPKLRISVAENQRPQNQDEKIYISKKEEHDEVSTVSVSSTPKAAEQENEPEIQDVKSLQTLASLKAFWEKENSGPKILISRSSTEHQNVVTDNRFKKQVEVGKINREPDVNLDIAGEVVLPKSGVPPLLEDVSGGKSKENIQPSPDTHKGKSVDLEEIIKDNGLHSIPFLAKVEGISSEKSSELASTVANKSPPTIEISCLTNGLNEQEMKYTAKSIVISEEVYTSQKGLKDISPSGKEEGDIPVVSVFLSRCSTQVQQVTPVPLVRQGLNQPDSKTGKISQLKTFWELDKIGPKNAVCQPKEATGSELYKPLEVSSEQFASSEFDLRKKVTELNSDDDKSVTPSELRQRPNFTVLSMKERMEKYSVSQTPKKSEFKNLRDFWRGEPSNKFDPQSPSTKVRCLNLESSQSEVQEATDALQKRKLQSPVETKMFINPNYYPKIPLIDPAKDHISLSRDGNPDVMTDSMNIQSPDKEFGENLPSVLQLEEKQQGFDKDMLSDSDVTNPAVETKARSFKVSTFVPNQDELYHLLQPQRGSEPTSMSEAKVSQSFTVPEDKVSDPLPAKITSLGNLNLRPQAFQQATSMFIRDPNEGQHKGVQENINKAHEESQSRRLPAYREGREIKPSGSSEVIQPQPPLARSFIIRDFQHYLGITEPTNVQYSPNGVKRENVSNAFFTPDAELEPSGGHRPIHVSTPVSSEKIPTRRGSRGQSFQPSEIAADGSDFEYTISNTPQTWSRSRGSSALLDEDEEQHPVRMALKRSLTRTMSSSKSLEDITSLPTIFTQAEESSKNNPEDELLLSMDDVSAGPFPPSASFSDPNQIRNMSKSVPAFLQKESDGRDSDSTSENSSYSGRQNRRGGSLTNLSNSSGMASMSSVSGSVMSVYSGDFGCVEVKGTIQFAINYVQKLKEFHIFVVTCKDLAAVDTKRNRSDPYVKSYLLPDKSRMGKRKTSVKKKTLNPIFNEILRYRVSMTALKTQTLNLSVWHNDTFGRNSFLGEVDLDLSKWDFSNTQMKEFTLRSRATSNLQPSDYRGEMRLALRFLPQITHSKRVSNTGEVHIWVKDCKNLPIIRGTAVDPFVKCFVLPDTSRKSRQKTRVLKRTSDPVFNHTMVYDGFMTEDLREACAELTVWDHDRLANHFLGGLRLGLGTGQSYGAEVDWMDSNPGESALWERMMQSPNEWVEDSLPLRMITKAKIVLK